MSDNRAKVLVVDDEDAGVLLRVLRSLPVDLIVTNDLAAARARLAADEFACVVLDLGLPDGYGATLLAAIRFDKPQLPVIIVTGTPTVQSNVNAAVLGALAYLQKPVEPEALRKQVSLAIWGPSMRPDA